MRSDDELASGALTIDPNRSNVVCFFGTKGSGKSSAARALFDAWPGDRLVIDVTGDARPDDPATIALAAPFPSQLPEPQDEQKRVTVWARVDPRSATYEHDQDQALGLGLHPRHRNTLCWVDEYGQAATAQRIPPNLRLALNSSRHYHLSLLFACPRPRFIPTLTISQADRIFIFRLPNPADREVIAHNAGIPVPLFERHYHEAQRRDPDDHHAFLLWDARNQVLLNCPPLPNIAARGPRA